MNIDGAKQQWCPKFNDNRNGRHRPVADLLQSEETHHPFSRLPALDVGKGDSDDVLVGMICNSEHWGGE